MLKKAFLLAAVFTIAATSLHASDMEAVIKTLKGYAAAIQSKDIAQIEKYVVTTEAFTIFEGGHVNSGWADYRDHHIGPELKQFIEIKYGFSDIKPRVFGDVAYATLKSSIDVKMKERGFSGKSLVTAVLVKTADGWKIQHLHTSRIPKKKH